MPRVIGSHAHILKLVVLCVHAVARIVARALQQSNALLDIIRQNGHTANRVVCCQALHAHSVSSCMLGAQLRQQQAAPMPPMLGGLARALR